jgi:hypothetical protein
MNNSALDLHGYSDYQLRRALERLREGLFDALAVRLLTAHREALDAQLQHDLQKLAADEPVHLCVCGVYGQGKSHTLAYLQSHALEQGYAVSAINLDPREIPCHQPRQVYRALIAALTLPPLTRDDTRKSLANAWASWARSQTRGAEDTSAALAALLPAAMPHVFKAILVALAQPTQTLTPRQQRAKRYRDHRPAVFPWTLRRALSGDSVPAVQLRPALKYRQVAFYRQGSLSLTRHEIFLRMILTLPLLLRRMGYKGWVLLFDEGEAIVQVRRPLRARAYRILHQLLYPDTPCPGLYPVFAFTPDFFQHLQGEDFEHPDFAQDYAHAWRHLSRYDLHSLSTNEWWTLCEQLVSLHAAAYRWHPGPGQLLPRLKARQQVMRQQETRVILKALVDELDQEQQQAFFARRADIASAPRSARRSNCGTS